MENRIKYMKWTEFDKRRKETKTVIIPSGAIEVYGPHLPLGSDIIVAEKIAQLIAEKVNAIVGPSVEIGESHSLYAFPGTLTTKPENLKAIYKDICKSFIKWGFNKIFVLNTHLGNTVPLNQILRELQDEYGVKCASVGWWQYIPNLSEDVFTTSNPHKHASEAGTSVLLYLCPEFVDMSKAPTTTSLYKDQYPNIIKYLTFNKFTNNGTIGDAKSGSAEKGKIVVERGVNEIANFIKDVLKNSEYTKTR